MNEQFDKVCPDCGREKATSANSILAGACPKWYAIRDEEARADCDGAKAAKETFGKTAEMLRASTASATLTSKRMAAWIDGVCKTCGAATHSCKCEHPNSEFMKIFAAPREGARSPAGPAQNGEPAAAAPHSSAVPSSATLPYPERAGADASLDVGKRFDAILREYRGLGEGSWAAARWYAEALANEVVKASAPSAIGPRAWPRHVLEAVHSALDNQLGDSDIWHLVNEEDIKNHQPVQWAATQIALLLRTPDGRDDSDPNNWPRADDGK